MTESSGGQPAGWYPDPEMVDTLRYWDGAEWTEHRAPAGQPAPPPPHTAAEPAAKAAKSGRPSSTVIGCLALVAIVIVGLAVIAIVGGDEKGTFQICQPAIVAELPSGNSDWTVSDAETREFPGGMSQATGTVKVNGVKYFYECQVVDGEVDKLSVGLT